MENDLAHLAIRLMDDKPPSSMHTIEAYYGFGETEHNEWSVLSGLVGSRECNPGASIFICGESAGNGYPGFES